MLLYGILTKKSISLLIKILISIPAIESGVLFFYIKVQYFKIHLKMQQDIKTIQQVIPVILLLKPYIIMLVNEFASPCDAGKYNVGGDQDDSYNTGREHTLQCFGGEYSESA